jgi:arylsulfatase
MDPPTRAAAAVAILLALDLFLGRAWGAGAIAARPGARRAARAAAALALVAALALNAWEWAWQRALDRRNADRPNILVFVVDALRADHVGCYGYDRDTTPTIDRLAAEGTRFTQAVSNGNMTRLTVPAIFAQLYPSALGLVSSSTRLKPKIVTIAELLRNEGYATAAYTPNPSLEWKLNFWQGFDVYDDDIIFARFFKGFETQEKINRRFLRWLDRQRGRPFFAYMHNCDAHAPYSPPAPFDTLFFDARYARPPRPVLDEEYARMHGYQRDENDGRDLNHYVNRYDGEVRYADGKLDELLAQLARRGRLERTTLFVSADHGEAFLEHGEWDHGKTVFDEVVHVPLIAWSGAGRWRGLVIDAPVHTFDISATALDIAGVEPASDVQARSLLPLLEGSATAVWEYAFTEGDDARALRTGAWKLVQQKEGGAEALYDLRADPRETTNVLAERPEVASEMRLALSAIVKANAVVSQGGLVEEAELDAETIEQLRGLGYIK